MFLLLRLFFIFIYINYYLLHGLRSLLEHIFLSKEKKKNKEYKKQIILRLRRKKKKITKFRSRTNLCYRRYVR